MSNTITNRQRKSMQTMIPVGEQLRDWRRRRRLSQMDLANVSGVSTRHISFVETGRSQPSRALLLRLSATLDVPLRQRNALMQAAGFAPLYRARSLDDAGMEVVRGALQRLLQGHMPYPALAVDSHWNLVSANPALMRLLEGVDPALLHPPANVLRVSLHPDGIANRIANLGEWRQHLIERLHHQIHATQDPVLVELLDELLGYPGPAEEADACDARAIDPLHALVVPLQLCEPAGGVLSFFSTTTVFGTPRDITVSELAIEAFFPADACTAQRMQTLMGEHPVPVSS